jgi:hypothetical protein
MTRSSQNLKERLLPEGGLAAAAYLFLQMQPAAVQRPTAARLARQLNGG